MLYTDFAEADRDLVYPNGYNHKWSLLPLKERLAISPKFVLDEHAAAMAANVGLSKPSSIIAALAFLNLAASPMWIEFSNQHIRSAMADLGSPNKMMEGSTVQIERTGFIVQKKDDDLLLEYIHRDIDSRMGAVVDFAPVQGIYSLANLDQYKEKSIADLIKSWRRSDRERPNWAGKVKDHGILLEKDDDEFFAYENLFSRFSFIPHPEGARLKQAVTSLIGEQAVAQVEERQANDMMRMFVQFVLPALILLNCRNAVDVETVPAPSKLNKQRQKKGKPPIAEYRAVTVHLSPTRRTVYESRGGVRNNVRGGLVIGHFKVRKSGVFWWSPFWRGSPTSTTPPKVYHVTR